MMQEELMSLFSVQKRQRAYEQALKTRFSNGVAVSQSDQLSEIDNRQCVTDSPFLLSLTPSAQKRLTC